jgi:outer membrane receptor protein involved in Fe transport/Tfp pilus assembly protein PilF
LLLGCWLGGRLTAADAFLSRVVELAGPVEFARAGAEQWQAAQTNLALNAGDRLRTGKAGRATLQLSDRSVIRLDQSSLLEIQVPSQAPAQKKFRLNFGRIFFLNRERPADIEFETPLATGAIRGTEFVLAAAEETGPTELALLDGAVALTTPRETVELASGEQVVLAPGQAAVKSRVLIAANLVQWCLYYPAVVDPSDLGLSAGEEARLADSLAAYRDGDVNRALETWPATGADSESARLLIASLKLAAGQVEEAVRLLDGASSDAPIARALREVIAAVKFQPLAELPEPTNTSAWLARSYYLQSRSDLPGALAAAKRAAPTLGFAQARVAELEWSFQNRRAALAALDHALALSPRNPAAHTVRGFILLDQHHHSDALASFDHALALDGTLGDAWLGRALCLEQIGEREEGRRALQLAAAMEPQRSVTRSYLGKAWSANGEASRAEKELRLARELDTGDPTPSLYEGLHLEQHNRFNEAVRTLERSVELNDHRSVFRSRLLLDQDRSVRSADLAAAYDAVGLSEAAERAAARALADSYANFSGHLFRAQSLQTREDPVRYNLRYETPRQSELLVANLLAPPGAGNLSQQLSQQDRLRWFGPAPVAVSSLTEYSSRGDWTEAASLFGQVAGLGYALDSQFVSRNGDRPNQEFERLEFSLQAKQQLGSADSVYLQVGWMDSESGDVAQYYDPAAASSTLRVEERQEPTLHLGWHHEWSPGSHTLLLASRLTDDLRLTDPSHPLLFLRQTGGVITDVDYGGVQRELSLENDFTLYSVELQHLLESPHHALMLGGRYQGGSVETASLLTGPLPPPLADQHVEPDFERLSAYAYYHWRPLLGLQFTAGLGYDHLTFPRNVDLPPVTSGEADRDLVAPRLGILWSPFDRTHLRAAWTRSLGGLYFDDSVRLEPSQVAGFTQAFRSLIPESVAGLVPGTEFETFGLGLDQSFRSGTYLGVEAELLRSNGEREVGAVSNSLPIPLPDTPTSTLQTLDFEERSLALYATQLVGDAWSFGARYRLSEAELTGRFPLIPAGASGASSLAQDEAATLHQVRLFALFNHASGFFAQWQTDWYQQSNQGYSPDRPGDDFWQHSLYVGYRFPRRLAEVRLGIQNLADQDYRLNPLNLSAELPRERTFVASLRLNF